MPLLPVVLVASVLVALYAGVDGLRGRAPERGLLRSLIALQLLLVVQAALALAKVLGPGVSETTTFVGYLVLSLLLLPGALALTVEERTRYGTLVLGAGALVVAVVELRLQATS